MVIWYFLEGIRAIAPDQPLPVFGPEA